VKAKNRIKSSGDLSPRKMANDLSFLHIFIHGGVQKMLIFKRKTDDFIPFNIKVFVIQDKVGAPPNYIWALFRSVKGP
jgi:hypothetical protein